MNTLITIVESDADGTIRIPLPPEMRHHRVRVTVEKAESDSAAALPGEEREVLLSALQKLRQLGTFSEIKDPVAWQREMRQERSLPGRE